MRSLHEKAKQVQESLNAFGLDFCVKEFSESTRSAAEAAAAIGCRVEQIAKSIVFRAKDSDRPVLAIVSGGNRVNEKQLSQLVGEPLGKADADFVRERIGYVIGGVPPVGHREKVQCFLDAGLLQYETVWAAAGTPFAVFALTPTELQRITGTEPAQFCDPLIGRPGAE